jgi:hypothetical protein
MFTRRSFVSLLVAFAVVGCANLLGPRNIEVSEAELQQIIARQFPVKNRYLELLDITVSAPRVKLLPDTNRLATELEVNSSDRLFKTPFKGSLTMNHSLRFEPGDNSLRLADVRVERFQMDGMPSGLQGQMNRIGSFLAGELLQDHVIHTLKPEDLKAAQGRGYAPGELKVTSRGITLTLNPVK